MEYHVPCNSYLIKTKTFSYFLNNDYFQLKQQKRQTKQKNQQKNKSTLNPYAKEYLPLTLTTLGL